MNHEQVHELLYQALETELGGIQVYQTALQCTVNAELQHEWQEYLAQTETHAQIPARALRDAQAQSGPGHAGTAGGPPSRAIAGHRYGDGVSGREP